MAPPDRSGNGGWETRPPTYNRAASGGASRPRKRSGRTEVRKRSSRWTDFCVQSTETSRSSHGSPQTGFRNTSEEIQEAQKKVVHK